MRQNDLNDIDYELTEHHYENIFDVYVDEDVGYFFNILKTVNFPENIDPSTYYEYEIRHGDSWASISWRVYKSTLLWWVLCSLNNVMDPLKDLISGEKIKILKPIYLRDILNTISTK